MPSNVKPHASNLIIAALALALGVLYIASAGGGFPLDDSWIHQTYGRNLAQYGEWAFTPGIPSTASTSPLYTVLLAAGYWLGVPFQVWTHGLGILALAVTGIIGAHLARRALPEQPLAGIVCGLALVGAWHLLWAAGAGMETMLFGMWTLVVIWLAWRQLGAEPASLSPRSAVVWGAAFGIASGLMTLTRAEGVMLAGLVALALVIARPGMSWKSLFLYGAAAAIAFIVVLLPYVSFNLQVTGGLLPNTAASKRADLAALFERPYPQRVVDMLIPLAAGAQILLLPGAMLYGWRSIRRSRLQPEALMLLVPLAWSVCLVLLYAAYLPAFFQHGRYVIPALPAFIVCGVIGTLMIAQRRPRAMLARVFQRALILTLALTYVLMALLLGRDAYVKDVSIIENEMIPAANWLRENAPPEMLLAVHDIGAVGYYAPRPIIDLAGLVSPELLPVIPVEQNGDAVWEILRERDARYVMGFADQLPGGNPADARLCPVFRARGADAEVSDVYNMSIYKIAWDGGC